MYMYMHVLYNLLHVKIHRQRCTYMYMYMYSTSVFSWKTIVVGMPLYSFIHTGIHRQGYMYMYMHVQCISAPPSIRARLS